jgi:hypothetical protein
MASRIILSQRESWNMNIAYASTSPGVLERIDRSKPGASLGIKDGGGSCRVSSESVPDSGDPATRPTTEVGDRESSMGVRSG